jgi:DNA-binding transcriptional LysR family regulator
MQIKPTEIKIELLCDLQRWRAFIAIGELGSLTRAAIFLNTTQSLLSRQINALERDCSMRLFNRNGRGVELSELGFALFPQIKSLLSSAERIEHHIRDESQEPSGNVTLGLLPSIALPIVSRLYKSIGSKYPKIHLKVLEGSSGQLEEWLSDDRVDIAVLYRYGSKIPDLEQILAVVDSYLIGKPNDRFTSAKEISFKSMNELPFILPGEPNGLRTTLDVLARQHKIKLTSVVEADSLPLQKDLVSKEGLYTVLPLHAVWSEVANGTLQAARINDPQLQRIISMAHSRTKGIRKAVNVVSQNIIELVDEMAHAGMWRLSEPRVNT